MAQNMAYVGECFQQSFEKMCILLCWVQTYTHVHYILLVDGVVEFFYILVDFVY